MPRCKPGCKVDDGDGEIMCASWSYREAEQVKQVADDDSGHTYMDFIEDYIR